ncbi:MAG: hypothetical protein LBV02_00030 [Bacteroidales bacterium]|jgi:hypothetical protein|nr:hypothetical protein [Bacteroidales bacterium]
MKTNKINPILFIVPLFVIGWGMFSMLFYDTFYSRAVDPEYPYLINGLNVSLLEFKRIGHFDHPGTPFQVFCGIIIRITHLFSGIDNNIAQDVLNRPDHYLNFINIFLIAIQACLLFFIGWIGKKHAIRTRILFILQLSFLCNFLLIDVFNRVIPERWLIITSILFIIIYLQYGYGNRKPFHFAVWSGIIMGMGMATKFNFLPIIFLPFLFIGTNKNRLIYAGTGIISFFIFIAPIITKFKDYWQFITGIASHDGIYGQGEERMFNPEATKANLLEVFHVAPELIFIISILITMLVASIVYRKINKESSRTIAFSIGILLITGLQILMVSKHFKNAYLIPLFSIYGIIFFKIDDFCTAAFTKKWLMGLFPAVISIFILFTAKDAIGNIPIQKRQKEKREQSRQYVADNLPENTLWFVEPTWESAPCVENGIVYGLSYCHRISEYLPELIQTNPNVITFEGMDNTVKIWRSKPVSLDSIVMTAAPIHIYSSPGRHADMLMEKVNQAAHNMGIEMQTDTLFSQEETGSYIIAMQRIFRK